MAKVEPSKSSGKAKRELDRSDVLAQSAPWPGSDEFLITVAIGLRRRFEVTGSEEDAALAETVEAFWVVRHTGIDIKPIAKAARAVLRERDSAHWRTRIGGRLPVPAGEDRTAAVADLREHARNVFHVMTQGSPAGLDRRAWLADRGPKRRAWQAEIGASLTDWVDTFGLAPLKPRENARGWMKHELSEKLERTELDARALALLALRAMGHTAKKAGDILYTF